VGWEERPLIDCTSDLQISYGVVQPGFPVPDGVPIVRVNNLVQGRINTKDAMRIAPEIDYAHRRTRLEGGELLLSLVGTTGNVAIAPIELAGWNVARAIAVIRPAKEIGAPWLKLCLESSYSREYLDARANTTVQKTLNLRDVKLLPIPLPPQHWKEEILSLVSPIERAITNLEEQNRNLEAMARTIFKSWFVDFDPVRAKAEGREPEGIDADTAALFPDEFEESQNGLFPVGWTRMSLGDISQVGIGKTPPRAQSQWFSESHDDIVWVSIRDMGRSGAYISTSSEFLTQEAVERFNVRVVPDNTVIVSFKLTVGRIAITDGRMTTNEAIAHCVLPDETKASTEYLYCALAAFDFTSLASTSSIAEAVNSKTIRALNLTVPSKVLMDRFTDFVWPLFQKIKNNQRTVETLSQVRDTLLPRLVSGKLRVPEAEKLVEAVL
jgi:type I restriction enzyme S subunit